MAMDHDRILRRRCARTDAVRSREDPVGRDKGAAADVAICHAQRHEEWIFVGRRDLLATDDVGLGVGVLACGRRLRGGSRVHRRRKGEEAADEEGVEGRDGRHHGGGHNSFAVIWEMAELRVCVDETHKDPAAGPPSDHRRTYCYGVLGSCEDADHAEDAIPRTP